MTHRPDGNRPTDRPAVRCSARSTRSGEQCRAFAVHGATVCVAHGGKAPQVRRAAARRRLRDGALAEGRRLLEGLGGRLDITPEEALLGQVHEAAANVAVLRAEISGLGIAVAHEGAIAIPEQRIEWDKGGTHVPARVHVLVDLYNTERDRLARFAKLAIDAGVAERQVRIAERQAEQLGAAFGRAVEAVEAISPEGRLALRQALAAELRGLAAGPGSDG